MKKIVSLFLILALLLSLSACTAIIENSPDISSKNISDISIEKAEQLAKAELKREDFDFEYVKYEETVIKEDTKCYCFYAIEKQHDNYNKDDDNKLEHRCSAWVYINAKTGSVHNYAECG